MKCISITGAGSGIGREVCRILARQGARVIAADQNLKSATNTIASLKGLKIKYYFFSIIYLHTIIKILYNNF